MNAIETLVILFAVSLIIWYIILWWIDNRPKRKRKNEELNDDLPSWEEIEVYTVQSWTTKWDGELSSYDRKELLKRSFRTQEGKDALEEEYQTKVLGNPPKKVKLFETDKDSRK